MRPRPGRRRRLPLLSLSHDRQRGPTLTISAQEAVRRRPAPATIEQLLAWCLRSGDLISGRPRRHLTSWGSRTAPGPPHLRVRSRPVWPHPRASPPCDRRARAGTARLAAWSWSTIHCAPLHDARWERGPDTDVIQAARPGEPRRAERRPHLDPLACRPAGNGGCAADLRTTVHPGSRPDPTVRACKQRIDRAHARASTLDLSPELVKDPEHIPRPSLPALNRNKQTRAQ